MWMRPSWDSQYTRTETERATTPYFLTKWIGASKLNVSVEHVTNSRHAPKRPAEQSMNGLGGVLDGRLGPDDCIRSGT